MNDAVFVTNLLLIYRFDAQVIIMELKVCELYKGSDENKY